MKNKEITNGNKLIAEFMGGYYFDDWTVIKFTKSFEAAKCKTYKLDTLKYHSSWDWLMPVVERISDICKANNSEIYVKFYNGTRKELLIFRHTKDETWTLCVDFIEWYNQNKDNN